jgi:hypothetical protein
MESNDKYNKKYTDPFHRARQSSIRENMMHVPPSNGDQPITGKIEIQDLPPIVSSPERAALANPTQPSSNPAININPHIKRPHLKKTLKQTSLVSPYEIEEKKQSPRDILRGASVTKGERKPVRPAQHNLKLELQKIPSLFSPERKDKDLVGLKPQVFEKESPLKRLKRIFMGVLVVVRLQARIRELKLHGTSTVMFDVAFRNNKAIRKALFPKVIKKALRTIGNKPFLIINPDSTGLLVWNWILLGIIVYVMTFMMYTTAFKNTSKTLEMIENGMDILFIADLILNFFVPYYNEDEE